MLHDDSCWNERYKFFFLKDANMGKIEKNINKNMI